MASVKVAVRVRPLNKGKENIFVLSCIVVRGKAGEIECLALQKSVKCLL